MIENIINKLLGKEESLEKMVNTVWHNPHIFCANHCMYENDCPFHRNNVEIHEGELPALFKGTPYCPDDSSYYGIKENGREL